MKAIFVLGAVSAYQLN
jgi:hypothetical protein